jgi:hypothetical protein
MSVLSTLQACVTAGKSINITPDGVSGFGPAIISAITQLFSGSIQLNGASFNLAATDSGDGAVLTGTGTSAPLVNEFLVTFTFVDANGNVTMTLTGALSSPIPFTSAWSNATYPFTDITLSAANVTATYDSKDSSYELDLSATVSFESNPVGTGLIVVKYSDSTLGFLGGIVVTGSWSPSDDIPILGTLLTSGEAGVFFSTITVSDLSAFKTLNLPYLPTEIDPGVTFLASITLGGSLARLSSLLPAGTELDLLANIPPEGISKATVTAAVTFPPPTGSFTFTQLSLTWASTALGAGSITLEAVAVFNDGNNAVDMDGKIIFTYDTENPTADALEGDLTVSGTGSWTHPFGVQNLTIESFSVAFSLAEDGISLGLGGTIGIGKGDGAVTLALYGAVDDFVPTFIEADLSPASAGKSVTLAQLVDDFLPSLDLTSFPLLNNISFQELEFYASAEAINIDNKQYEPGIGATGDIDFFGYTLDFAFSLVTSPSVAVKAMGNISHNGGPIVITAAGMNLLTISDASGAKGASACIDTTGSGYCGSTGGDGNYFTINASVNLLGLVGESIVAQASQSSFGLDLAMDTASVFTEKLHVEFIPSSNDFAASVATGFNPPNITLGPWGVIPQFTIPTPNINLCCALGTVVPTAAPCSDGWTPDSAPYFHLDFDFTWGPISFSLNVSLQLSQVTDAFNDFASWIQSYVLSNAGQILQDILADATKLAQLLLYLGKEIAEFAEWVYDKVVSTIMSTFGYLYDQAAGIVKDALSTIEQCAQEVADANLPAPVGPSVGSAATLSAVSSGAGGGRIRVAQFEMDLAATSGGQQLLYQYYVNRSELRSILKSDTAAGAACREIITQSGSLPADAKVVPNVINLLKASQAAGSTEYQASVEQVVGQLEQHRDQTYSELLVSLAK